MEAPALQYGIASVVVAFVANIAAQTTENVSGICWFHPLGDLRDGYGVLLSSAAVYPVVFGVMLVGYRAFCVHRRPGDAARMPWVFSRQHVVYAFQIAIPNSLNGVLIMYMTNGLRTPALTQQGVFALGVIMTMAANVLFLKHGDKGTLSRYKDWRAVSGIVAVIVAVVLSVVPILQNGRSDPEGTANQIGYSALFILGQAAGVVYNVMQGRWFELHDKWEAEKERYGESAMALKADEEEGDLVSRSPHMYVKLNLLFFQTLFMLLQILALFWTDLIPWFGYSGPHMGVFKQRVSATLRYSVLPWEWSQQGPGQAGYYWLMFQLAYVVSFVAATVMNEYSTTIAAVSNQVCPLAGALLFQVGRICGTRDTFPWSLLAPALALGTVGTLLFGWFEHDKNKHRELGSPRSARSTMS